MYLHKACHILKRVAALMAKVNRKDYFRIADVLPKCQNET